MNSWFFLVAKSSCWTFSPFNFINSVALSDVYQEILARPSSNTSTAKLSNSGGVVSATVEVVKLTISELMSPMLT